MDCKTFEEAWGGFTATIKVLHCTLSTGGRWEEAQFSINGTGDDMGISKGWFGHLDF